NRRGLRRRERVDADAPARPAGALELDQAVDHGEARVVAAAADARAGVDPRAALADQDAARADELTIIALHAQALCVAVAPVAGTAAALLRREQLQVHDPHALTTRP